MQCRGKIRGGSTNAQAWYPVQVNFASASNCNLLSDSLAEDIGLELHELLGCHTVQHMTGVSTITSKCQVGTNVSIQLEVQSGSFVKLDLPIVVVPKKELCKYRELILGMPFLSKGFSLGPNGLSLYCGPSRTVNIKLDEQGDTIPKNVVGTGMFYCTEELRKICDGKVALSTDHTFSPCSHDWNYLEPGLAENMDKEFQNLLDSLTLSEQDCHELLEKRGFQPAQIERAGFKSWPGGHIGLPFMTSKFELGSIDVPVPPSLLIPARTQDGRITAIHIKPHREEETDLPRNLGKYMWASRNRSFKLHPVESEGCEVPLFVCAANKGVETTVALVEGGLKAYAFAAQLKVKRADLHSWVIGAAGGQFWQSELGLFWAMAGMQPEAVVLYPDAGAIVNIHVLLNYFRSFRVMLDMDMDVQIAWWGQWSKEEHLDVDDFLLQGGSFQQMKYISVIDFWNKIPAAIKLMLKTSRHAEVFDEVLQLLQ